MSTNSPSKLLGFDSQGEVFLYENRLLRGVFPKHGDSLRKIYDMYINHKLVDRGIVKTQIVDDAEFHWLGYDMVLEHEKVPFISYAHEWPLDMIKDAALFQLNLNLELNKYGMLLKDCGVPSNILFNATYPVFVDFLSIIFHDDLTKQDFLKPNGQGTSYQSIWDKKSVYFNEIFRRMFYPYTLHPLYMMHQGRHSEARRRMLETTLNSCSDVITQQEALAEADAGLTNFYQRSIIAREDALVNNVWSSFLNILSDELKQLSVSVDESSYASYYEQKGEAFGFDPCEDWLPKQRVVYDILQALRPSTVLDIGANTGWFSILAAGAGCRVVALDDDEACMCLLYKRSKREGLPILPLVMDIVQPTQDVPASPDLATDLHMISSRISGDAPLLLSAVKRLKCDMVLALAITHHLALGQGLRLKEITELLASFSSKYLVMEFVPKEDPLIVRQADFFPAFYQDPRQFGWYSQDNWHRQLSEHYKHTMVKDSTGGRKLFICCR